MGYKEKEKIKEILKNLTPEQRLFRVNSGQGWAGKVINKRDNKIVIENAVPFYGMPAGTSDLIGFTSKIVTPEMVGKRVAIFEAVEVKTESYKTVTTKQNNFLKMVSTLGGIARVVK